MREYLSLRLRKMAPLFLVPMLVEVVFLFFRMAKPKNETISAFHGIWYLAASAVLVFVTSYKIMQMYYVGSDRLIGILPFANEWLTLIEIAFYSLFTLLFGYLYHYINNYQENYHFAFADYTLQKLLSLLSFYLLLFMFCALFKNVRKAAVGKTLILLFTAAVIILEIVAFIKLNDGKFLHFFSGVSTPDVKMTYLNVLPFDFFGSKASSSTAFTNQSYLLNGGTIFFSLFLSLGLKRFASLSYVDLEG
ncbi:hypothetical protein PT285_03910 [Lactobacillus sp. ESL0791]|uniref:hypothetical protein n=1 Tax=Lactobacillus sp. ESL0791 TaxID=2983234 RepID=UPI0023F61D8E|nr:hypothetical protein [Lactobacillus sp. ESL0791]MDF7638555.1 hypothetical protein [Lactobacillus sp. ESL0791]